MLHQNVLLLFAVMHSEYCCPLYWNGKLHFDPFAFPALVAIVDGPHAPHVAPWASEFAVPEHWHPPLPSPPSTSLCTKRGATGREAQLPAMAFLNINFTLEKHDVDNTLPPHFEIETQSLESPSQV